MDLINNSVVEITTFVNPHLFWIIGKNNQRVELLNNLIDELQKIDKTTILSTTTFEIGEIVAGQVNNVFYRGIIEDIERENGRIVSYLIWLIDFGTIRETNFVFKLPAELRKIPPLAIQASLINVVYKDKVIDYDSGNASCIVKNMINPTPSAIRESNMFLERSVCKRFQYEKVEDGIWFGDIICTDKEGNEESLKDFLIKKELLDVNTSLFKDISDFINKYKESHLMFILKTCNLYPLPLNGDNKGSKNIVSKVLEEFNNFDILSFEDEEADFLWSSRRSNNGSLDTSLSDIDMSLKEKSKRNKLMEKLLQNKSEKSSVSTNNQKASHLEPKSSDSKVGKLVEKLKQHKTKKEMSAAGTLQITNNTNKNIIFTASGSERSKLPSISKQKRTFPKKNYSSEDSYSEKIKMVPKRNCTSEDSSSEKNSVLHKEQSTPYKELKNDDSTFEESFNSHKSNVSSQTSMTETGEETSDEVDENNSKKKIENHSKEVSIPASLTMKIKPHCSCRQCEMWTKEEEIYLDQFNKNAKVDKIIGLDNQFLFKEGNISNENLEICSIDYSSLSKIDKQSKQILLVHSESVVNPVHQVSQVAFEKHIQKNLYKLGYRQTKKIQSYVWPAIFRNQHVFMISGPQSGKTMAYLPVMCSFVMEKYDRYDSLLKLSGGPIVIILCANTQKCENLYDLTRILLENLRFKLYLVTYPLTYINTSNTDMLITTPNILVELVKNKCINFKRLCHLIIEDGDIILQNYKETMSSIFELAQSMLKHRVFARSLQLIVCAEHWNSQIKSLMKNLQQIPTICIGNYLEAALYGKLEFSIKFTIASCKLHEIKNFLKDNHKINRSIIICKEDEIAEIYEILTLYGIDSIPMYEHLTQEDLLHYEEIWSEARAGFYSVLICSDFVLNTILTVTCANTVIHYSLPKSWSKFQKRFCCFLENCHSPLSSKETKLVSSNIVLCDESCEEQINRFFNFIKHTDLNKQLPDKLKHFSQSLKDLEEDQKIKKELILCDNLKLFGKCNRSQCSKRHYLSKELDVSNYLPKIGKIKFKIVNILDTTTFSIKLLQHVDSDKKVHEYEEVEDITDELTATIRLGRKKIYNPVIGHFYAFYNCDEEEGIYHRCQLLNIYNDSIQIKLLDNGKIVNTVISRIYRLPNEFNCNERPRALIDAILVNLVPPFNDENYSSKSFYNIQMIMEKHDYKNLIFTADVCLQLNHTLWIKNVYEEIALSDKIIPGFQLSRELLTKKLCVSNSSQLQNLYKLCDDFDIIIPKYEEHKENKSTIRKEKIKLQWAHFEDDVINEVTFASAFSPDNFYVRLNKFSGLLYNLQKEIQESIKKPHYPEIHEVEVGEVYLAKDPGGDEYGRVLVLKKESEKALCFFLDFADECIVPLRELKYIQPEFITKLPFQCILCQLHGIKPFDKNWEESATDMLYEYAHEPETDIFRTLFVKVCKKEKCSFASERKYSVLLKDGFGEKNILINQLLIDCGLVTNNPEEEINNFEIPQPQNEEPNTNEELEKIAYICKKTDELALISQSKEEIEEDLNEFELFICGDPMDFYSQFMEREERTIPRSAELPAITAAPPVDYYTPQVYWSQTDKIIRLSIRLVDVIDYKLTLTKGRILNFNTVKEQKNYCLKIMFYELVETMQHTIVGPEIRVTVNKIKPIDWPRLILSKQKSLHIHYDVTKMCVNEEEKKRFLQFPKELDLSDGDELNDDDPMYTVVSDLDSDLDLELEFDSD